MRSTIARWAPFLILAALASGCAPAPAPTAPSPDQGAARQAASVALTALSHRKFDVHGCAAAEARLVQEAEARAGTPQSERCAVLVARQSDRTWLVVVRSSLSSSSVGAQALVTVLPEAEGVSAVEYAR
ncbi:hypothetical protein BE17_48565 [Sorangium cellulosum]|uniref:Secreted protein n=1 Tax=Sorangium cellulosum TaxID=56 RepID=A0A150SG82_SORCE|nr:hypothetical protein BE17_48565 [Sorangium cellulosum]